MTYHLSKEEVTLSKLQGLLRLAESGLKGKCVEPTPTADVPIMAIGQGKWKKRKAPSKQNWKGNSHDGPSSNGPKGKTNSSPPASNPKDATWFYCKDKGHWKRNCPMYLQDIKDVKMKPASAGIKRK
ncbi:uncharacterized protein LOC111894688 [Lactuca sativa]|uniref:uncharacterized protein LOC111894688 n=1 Tax=Lactuca sativa TaxID=4236 RepID=UPI000CD80177|nr:uncharacterized protein LOC111894688 [Lactuca sativa]